VAAAIVAKPKRFAYSSFMPVKVREVLRLLAADGWVIIRQHGSHRQLAHPMKPGTVTVAGHPSDTLSPGTERSIRRQAGLPDRI
jgi:predicted RNA binding protein YcfA (HicA-like mRNA interferase family)